MKIGIISDTHNNLENIKKAWQIFKKEKVSVVIHCGDWSNIDTVRYVAHLNEKSEFLILGVLGNNDKDISEVIKKEDLGLDIFPERIIELELEKRIVAIYHGENRKILKDLVCSETYDAVFSGHTHRVKNEIIKKTLDFNPGTAGFNRFGQIERSFTIGIYDSEANSAEVREIQV